MGRGGEKRALEEQVRLEKLCDNPEIDETGLGPGMSVCWLVSTSLFNAFPQTVIVYGSPTKCSVDVPVKFLLAGLLASNIFIAENPTK